MGLMIERLYYPVLTRDTSSPEKEESFETSNKATHVLFPPPLQTLYRLVMSLPANTMKFENLTLYNSFAQSVCF